MKEKHTAMLPMHLSLVLGGILIGLFPFAQTYGSPPLLDPNDLAEIGLKMAWQRPLPLYEDESIEALVLREDRLYLLTDRNYVISLRRHDGGAIFMRKLGFEGFTVNGWQLEGDQLLTAVGEVLTVLSPKTGSTLGAKDFGFNLACAPVSNEQGIYLAGTDHRVHAIGRKDHVVHYGVGTPSGGSITGVKADKNRIVMASDGGDVMAMRTGTQPIQSWVFQAGGSIAGPLVVDSDSLFLACHDTYVYRLNLNPQAERLVWRTQCDAPLETGPWVTANTVYQFMKNVGVMAIHKDTGATLWTQAGASDLLAESGPWAYLWTHDRKIVVMDNEKGQWAHMLTAPQLTIPCMNTIDAEIYLADDQGRIVCLTPVH
jgi:hypothetical protein